jgi:hypothetical protein
MVCSMSATASQSLADRTPTSFEEFRALWETEDPQKGLAGLLQRWISRLLTALAALLAEARAAKLDDAPCAASAESAASAPCAEAGASEVCAADGEAGLLRRMAMASRNGGAGEARRARARAVHAAKRRWSRLAPRRADSGVLAPIAAQGAHIVRIVPLTLPHRAPFLPAKMGTRRGPLPPGQARWRCLTLRRVPLRTAQWGPIRGRGIQSSDCDCFVWRRADYCAHIVTIS